MEESSVSEMDIKKGITMRDVIGFDGKYKVDEYGNVYSCHKKRYVKPQIFNGYKRYTLSKGGRSVSMFSHRIVAEAYLKPIEGSNVVNHIDLNRLNNHYSNLEWCTPYQNYVHAVESGVAPKRVFSEEDIVKIYDMRERGIYIKHIAEHLGVTKWNVMDVLRGRTYKWVKKPISH